MTKLRGENLVEGGAACASRNADADGGGPLSPQHTSDPSSKEPRCARSRQRGLPQVRCLAACIRSWSGWPGRQSSISHHSRFPHQTAQFPSLQSHIGRGLPKTCRTVSFALSRCTGNEYLAVAREVGARPQDGAQIRRARPGAAGVWRTFATGEQDSPVLTLSARTACGVSAADRAPSAPRAARPRLHWLLQHSHRLRATSGRSSPRPGGLPHKKHTSAG